MDIEFEDASLSMIETEAAAETCLPVAVIQTARQRLSIMRAAPDTRTLWNWKSLGLQSAAGSTEHHVVLSSEWSMVVKILEKNNTMTVIVMAMKQQLRGAA
jgi:proteic killer suppression protein